MSVNSISRNINSICSLLKTYSGKTTANPTNTPALAGSTGAAPLPLSNAMKSAIVSALQKSDSSMDPNDIIQETIQKVLGENKNVNTSMKIDDKAFNAYLQTLGVDAQALNQDIQMAVGNYQWETGKQPDYAKLFTEPPKGSMINVAA